MKFYCKAKYSIQATVRLFNVNQFEKFINFEMRGTTTYFKRKSIGKTTLIFVDEAINYKKKYK